MNKRLMVTFLAVFLYACGASAYKWSLEFEAVGYSKANTVSIDEEGEGHVLIQAAYYAADTDLHYSHVSDAGEVLLERSYQTTKDWDDFVQSDKRKYFLISDNSNEVNEYIGYLDIENDIYWDGVDLPAILDVEPGNVVIRSSELLEDGSLLLLGSAYVFTGNVSVFSAFMLIVDDQAQIRSMHKDTSFTSYSRYIRLEDGEYSLQGVFSWDKRMETGLNGTIEHRDANDQLIGHFDVTNTNYISSFTPEGFYLLSGNKDNNKIFIRQLNWAGEEVVGIDISDLGIGLSSSMQILADGNFLFNDSSEVHLIDTTGGVRLHYRVPYSDGHIKRVLVGAENTLYITTMDKDTVQGGGTIKVEIDGGTGSLIMSFNYQDIIQIKHTQVSSDSHVIRKINEQRNVVYLSTLYDGCGVFSCEEKVIKTDRGVCEIQTTLLNNTGEFISFANFCDSYKAGYSLTNFK